MQEFLVFQSVEAAQRRSAEAMGREQSGATRRDPSTVTRYLWGMSENAETGRASLEVPEDDRALLTVGEAGKTKSEGDARKDKDKADLFKVPLPSEREGRGE